MFLSVMATGLNPAGVSVVDFPMSDASSAVTVKLKLTTSPTVSLHWDSEQRDARTLGDDGDVEWSVLLLLQGFTVTSYR